MQSPLWDWMWWRPTKSSWNTVKNCMMLWWSVTGRQQSSLQNRTIWHLACQSPSTAETDHWVLSFSPLKLWQLWIIFLKTYKEMRQQYNNVLFKCINPFVNVLRVHTSELQQKLLLIYALYFNMRLFISNTEKCKVKTSKFWRSLCHWMLPKESFSVQNPLNARFTLIKKPCAWCFSGWNSITLYSK